VQSKFTVPHSGLAGKTGGVPPVFRKTRKSSSKSLAQASLRTKCRIVRQFMPTDRHIFRSRKGNVRAAAGALHEKMEGKMALQGGRSAKRMGKTHAMKFKFRGAIERRHPGQLFIMLSQFSTNTFRVPVRRFRTAGSLRSSSRQVPRRQLKEV